MGIKKLQLEQLSKALSHVHVPPRPRTGWIHAIRNTLGMTTRQLAVRMGVAQSTVVALEQSEADEKITLHSLKRAAEALDCELRYVLVPRKDLKNRVQRQAELIASNTVANVTHTMRLEAQEPSSTFTTSATSEEAAKLLQGRWSKLWDR